jgi:hypothetical protein
MDRGEFDHVDIGVLITHHRRVTGARGHERVRVRLAAKCAVRRSARSRA